MDEINELIAAGESMVKTWEKQKSLVETPVTEVKASNPFLKKLNSEFQDSFTYQNSEDNIDYCPLNVFNSVIDNASNSHVNHHKLSNTSSLSTHTPSDYDYNSKNQIQTFVNNGLEAMIAPLDMSRDHSSRELFSQDHIVKLKEECALIFSVSHAMALSLSNANRLLSGKINSNSLGQSSEEESLLSEISTCEDNCKENEATLKASGNRIHHLLGQLSESYYRSKDQEAKFSCIKVQSFDLLQMMKELLMKNNLSHLVADMSDNRLSPSRILEEVNLGLTLLSGELPSRLLEEQTEQLDELYDYQQKLKERIEYLEKELKSSNEKSNKKISEAEIELEKVSKQLIEERRETEFLQKQKEDLESFYKKQLEEVELKRISLTQEVMKAKRFVEEEEAANARERAGHEMAKKDMEDQVASFRNKLRSLEEQKSLQEKDAEKCQKQLEGNQARLLSEIGTLKTKWSNAEMERQSCLDRIKGLEEDLKNQNTINESLKEDILAFREAAQSKSGEVQTELLHLEKRMDAQNEELCEKHSEVRSMEVQILEAKTELDLERQRSLTLRSEVDLLTKQVDRLQEKVKKLVQFCPRDVRILCGLTQFKDRSEAEDESKFGKLLEESHSREAELKRMLGEKDEEMKRLQMSLTDQIQQKNKELDLLSSSVESLEDEMSQITCSLSASSDLYAASQQTRSFLGSRSRQIQTLQDKVIKLSVSNSCETPPEAWEELRAELSEAKKNVRAAREEARKERIEAAKLRQQLAMAKIDLESARENSKYHWRSHSIDKSQDSQSSSVRDHCEEEEKSSCSKME